MAKAVKTTTKPLLFVEVTNDNGGAKEDTSDELDIMYWSEGSDFTNGRRAHSPRERERARDE